MMVHPPRHREAFTLVELLVCIAIIGVFVGLSMPAVQAVRESARRAKCQSRMFAISLGLHSYHDRFGSFPIGTTDDAAAISHGTTGHHHNWIGRMLPQMDLRLIHEHIDPNVSIYDPANAAVLNLHCPKFHCPSAAVRPENVSDYAGIHGPQERPIDAQGRGVFLLNEAVRRDDITDGLSYTAVVAEKISYESDLGWLSGTRSTLRCTGGGIEASDDAFQSPPPSALGSIGSYHADGAMVLYGSGEIQLLSRSVDAEVLRQIANRADGELPLGWMSIQQQREQMLQKGRP
ncbi:MAG: DUF1559 domain-containing protein [Planctomycetota bacterium]